MTYSLADVVKKCCPARFLGVRTQFGGEHVGHLCRLDQVVEYILAIRHPILQSPQEIHEFRMKPTQADLENGPVAHC